MPAKNGTARAAAVEAAVGAVSDKDTPVEEVTLDNGVVLGIKAVPPQLVRRAVTRLKRPLAPKFHNEENGREEENPNDPEYVNALAAYEEASSTTGTNVLLAAGTWLASKPDDVPGPDEQGWREMASFFEIDVDESSGLALYLSWLNLYAITSEEEWVRVLLAVSSRTGVSEEDVQRAMLSFRGAAARGADSGVPAEVAADGDRVPEDAAAPGP